MARLDLSGVVGSDESVGEIFDYGSWLSGEYGKPLMSFFSGSYSSTKEQKLALLAPTKSKGSVKYNKKAADELYARLCLKQLV